MSGHIHTDDAATTFASEAATILALRLVLTYLDLNDDALHDASADLQGDGVGADCPYCMCALSAALVRVAVRGFDELGQAKADDPEFPGAAAFVTGLLATQLDEAGES